MFPHSTNKQTYDKRRALSAQVVAEGSALCAKYGPGMPWQTLMSLLQDRAFVRFPCAVRFDAEPLLPGEFAHAMLNGREPEEGYTIIVHPVYEGRLECLPYLVLHQLVLVNHGEAASAEDAETFGACALGLPRDQYYATLCELSGQVGGDDLL